MHAHDRTLLASLGFKDPDKGTPYHDLGCQYIDQDDVRAKIGPLFGRRAEKLAVERTTVNLKLCQRTREVYFSRLPNGDPTLKWLPAEFEMVVSKGEGKYKTHIGFLDAVLRYKAMAPFLEKQYKVDYVAPSKENRWQSSKQVGSWIKDVTSFVEEEFTVVAEVKIHPVTVGEILRQIKLYQEYVPAPSGWLLATYFDLSLEDVAQLKQADITHVRLGAGFEEYVAKRGETARVPAPSLEL